MIFGHFTKISLVVLDFIDLIIFQGVVNFGKVTQPLSAIVEAGDDDKENYSSLQEQMRSFFVGFRQFGYDIFNSFKILSFFGLQNFLQFSEFAIDLCKDVTWNLRIMMNIPSPRKLHFPV